MRVGWAMLGALACAGGAEPTGESGGEPAPTTEEVAAAIEAANRCEAAEECVTVGSQCPFGCWILVNEEEADEVVALLEAWREDLQTTCTYSCANLGAVTCVDKRCEGEAIYRAAPRP